MTGVREREEGVVEIPEATDGPGRSRTLRLLAIVIAAAVALAVAWLVFRDSSDEESTTTDPTTEAVVEEDALVEDVGFPFGRFENRDTGLRVMILNRDGTYAFNDRGFAVSGVFEFDADLFTVLTEDQQQLRGPGMYSWTFEDDTLEFARIDDTSANRNLFLSREFTLTE